MLIHQASQIQAHVDEFEFFLFHPDTREPMSVPDFCNRVMGLGKEAGEPGTLLDALHGC
jgi:ubiquitin thioesterase protein OTUB1